MKQYFLIALFFLSVLSLSSQDIKMDILDIFPALIDKGSIKHIDGMIRLKIHSAENGMLTESPLAVTPDPWYSMTMTKTFSEEVYGIMDSLESEINDMLVLYLDSLSIKEDEMTQKNQNEFIDIYLRPIIKNIYMTSFGFKEDIATYFLNSYLNGENIKTTSFVVEVDCMNNTLEYKSMIFTLNDGSIDNIEMSKEIRHTKDMNARGSTARLFSKVCSGIAEQEE